MTKLPITPTAISAIAFAALALLALVFVPESRLDKLGQLLGRIVEDPAGALAAVTALASIIATLRAAWTRRPPDGPSSPGTSSGPSTPAPPGGIERRHVPLRLTVPLLALLAGCSPSALRTHGTIATVARVSVLVAGDAITRTCATALAACTDDACVERVGADCTTAATAQTVARATVHAYVDAIEVAAHADEGAIAEALDTGLVAVARVYGALREALATIGVTLPPLPPAALSIVRALVAGVAS